MISLLKSLGIKVRVYGEGSVFRCGAQRNQILRNVGKAMMQVRLGFMIYEL